MPIIFPTSTDTATARTNQSNQRYVFCVHTFVYEIPFPMRAI